MADRDEVLAYARELLDLDSFRDYGPMGLQVVGSPTVQRIACGVSSSKAPCLPVRTRTSSVRSCA